MAFTFLGSLVSTVSGITNVVDSANTASSIMARDASGQVAATTFTGALAGNATSATTAGSATSFSGSLSGDVTGTQSATVVANAALTALAAGGATTGQYLAFNGTNWAPATLTAVTGTGSSQKVAVWSGTGTMTFNSALDFHTGGAGTARFSVGKTPDNTGATVAGRVETNLIVLNDFSVGTANTVSIVPSTTQSAAYSVILPTTGPSASGQSLVTSTSGSTATLSWATPSAPTGTANTVAYFDGSGNLTSDSNLVYDGTDFTAPNLFLNGELHVSTNQATGATYNIASTDTSIESNGATQTFNLPALTASPAGRVLTITATTGVITVTPNGADIFANTGNNTPITVGVGQALQLISNSNQTAWDIVGSYGMSSGGGTNFSSKSGTFTAATAGGVYVYDLQSGATPTLDTATAYTQVTFINSSGGSITVAQTAGTSAFLGGNQSTVGTGGTITLAANASLTLVSAGATWRTTASDFTCTVA